MTLNPFPPRAFPEFLERSVLPGRKALLWPEGKTLALTVVLHLEHWDLSLRRGSGDPRISEVVFSDMPDFLNFSWFEYGLRTGFDRVYGALKAIGCPLTVSVDRASLLAYPELVQRLHADGAEIACGGLAANHMLSSTISAADEKAMIAETKQALEALIGAPVTGWIGNGWSVTTADNLAELGFDHIMALSNDEQPEELLGSRIISLPRCQELDDIEILQHRKVMPWAYPGLIAESLAQSREDSHQAARMVSLHLRPWVSGKAYNMPGLRKMLAGLQQEQAQDDVWFTTAAAASAAYRAHRG